MDIIKLKTEHRGAQMNLYKIKKYDTVKIGYGDMDIVLHENIWIGYDLRHIEYVICAEANPCEIQHVFPIISNDIILTFTNENEKSNSSLHLCCNGEQSDITFDKKELRWKICISSVQPEFVKCALRELFDDAYSAWLNTHIAMNSFYGLSLAQLGKSGLPEIKDVIFNAPATIVFWADDTKTVVKAQGEIFDREKGLAMAITKKVLGNEGRYYETIKKWIKEEE